MSELYQSNQPSFSPTRHSLLPRGEESTYLTGKDLRMFTVALLPCSFRGCLPVQSMWHMSPGKAPNDVCYAAETV